MQRVFCTMDKRALRQKYKEIRKNVNNDGIAERFISLPLFLAAKSVMTYISINNEPDTSPILLHSEKTVLVPVTYKESGIIKACVYGGETVGGAYGIPQPKELKLYPAEKIDVVTVPGICYCTNGARLGYGGGYYDRFLRGFRGIKVGFCYEECLTAEDFSEEHDIFVDYIITQERIIKI